MNNSKVLLLLALFSAPVIAQSHPKFPLHGPLPHCTASMVQKGTCSRKLFCYNVGMTTADAAMAMYPSATSSESETPAEWVQFGTSKNKGLSQKSKYAIAMDAYKHPEKYRAPALALNRLFTHDSHTIGPQGRAILKESEQQRQKNASRIFDTWDGQIWNSSLVQDAYHSCLIHSIAGCHTHQCIVNHIK